MSIRLPLAAFAAGFAVLPAAAQDHSHHAPSPAPSTAHHPAAHAMPAAFGRYPHAREASGTSWQPDSSPIQALHFAAGDWSLMAHGNVWAIANHQGGPRGDDKLYSQSMAMLMASRPLGASARLSLRAMLSLDPLTMGRRGYPLLFATGETADGRTPLVDRQHPHDLFMELSASVSHDLSDTSSVFIYAGLPGEPALGPPAFMHRVSAMDLPEAPLAHHWIDSTHITFGVVTAGVVAGDVKLEASAFKGREPNQRRYDIERPKLDSWSVRASWNPGADWSTQLSYGELTSPEQLHPEDDERRLIGSVAWNRPLADGNIALTAGAARKWSHDERSDALFAEAGWRFGRNALSGRWERVENPELFEEEDPLAGTYAINRFTLAYLREFPVARGVTGAAGLSASLYAFPGRLDPVYGDKPKSLLAFVRLRLGD